MGRHLPRPRPRELLALIALAALMAPGVALLRRSEGPGSAEPSERSSPQQAVAGTGLEFEPQPSSAPHGVEDDWFDRQPAPTAVSKVDQGYECIVEPSDLVSIGSPTRGWIRDIYVERADVVEAGQVVVELDDRIESAAVAAAKERASMTGQLRSREATAQLEKRRRKRADHLYNENAVSLDLLDEVETQAEVAALELQRAQENRRLASLEMKQAIAVLEYRTIRSPIPGIIVERAMSPGEVVDEETILRVARIDPLWVQAVLPGAHFGSVKVGMRGAVTPEVPGDQIYVAEVVVVDRVIDPASGTFSVRLELPNRGNEIPSGLHCRVRFLED